MLLKICMQKKKEPLECGTKENANIEHDIFAAVAPKSKQFEMQSDKAEHRQFSNGHHRVDNRDDALMTLWIIKTVHKNVLPTNRKSSPFRFRSQLKRKFLI